MTTPGVTDPVFDLLEHLDEGAPRLSLRDGEAAGALAAAGLARSTALLDGARTLARVGRADLYGVFTRLVRDCWLVGAYLIVGGPGVVEEVWNRATNHATHAPPHGSDPVDRRRVSTSAAPSSRSVNANQCSRWMAAPENLHEDLVALFEAAERDLDDEEFDTFREESSGQWFLRCTGDGRTVAPVPPLLIDVLHSVDGSGHGCVSSPLRVVLGAPPDDPRRCDT